MQIFFAKEGIAFMEIYLDNSSTTRIDESVINEMVSFSRHFGNPSSAHSLGNFVKEKIENSRKKIADYINADSSEIIFTSGATESNNFAIKGLAISNPNKKHIITSVIEHPSVLNSCKALEKQGYKIDYVKVDKEGIVNVEEIRRKIRGDTLLVSIMLVNNEIGTIQQIKSIGKICEEKNVYFHTDAAQGFKKMPIDVNEMKIDLMSVSGHKINGPKGIGFLYIKLGTRIRRVMDGGEQEFKLRAGTENTLGIIGIAKSLDVEMNKEYVKNLRDYFLEKLSKLEGAKINGSIDERVYDNINISFYGIDGNELVSLLDKEKIYISSSSACASYNLKESHVLSAILTDPLYIHGSIRMTLDKNITKENIDYVFEKIKNHLFGLRENSLFRKTD